MPSSDRPDALEQIVVSVVGGQVRIHSLKQAQHAPDPEARQVFAGSPATLADFFRDIQAGLSATGNPSTDPAKKSAPA
jgi:hypothetical protein